MLKKIRQGSQSYSQYFYLLPSFLFVVLVEIAPAIYTISISFQEWDLLYPPSWVGLSNYLKIFADPTIIQAVLNSFAWIIVSLLLTGVLALILAVFINSFNKITQSVFTIIFVAPYVFSPTIAGKVFVRIFSSTSGGINSILKLIGMSDFSLSWLTLTGPFIVPINTILTVIAFSWRYLGLNLLLFLVGLSSIPKYYSEAAEIDGANQWQIFYHVTLPLLRPITLLVVANTIINTWRMFSVPWVMTGGGPGRASETLALTMYRESFLLFNAGFGAAIAVFIAIIGLLLSGRWLRSYS